MGTEAVLQGTVKRLVFEKLIPGCLDEDVCEINRGGELVLNKEWIRCWCEGSQAREWAQL